VSRPLPAPTPQINPETRAYWDAAKEGKFILRRCNDCHGVIWYPRAICPECWSNDVEWFDASGRGTVYTFTVNYRGEGAYAKREPYVLAYVELQEGPRIMTNIVADDPSLIEVGSPVAVVFHPTDDGESALPRFQLT
jgi:uncharacterized OB-fold protein